MCLSTLKLICRCEPCIMGIWARRDWKWLYVYFSKVIITTSVEDGQFHKYSGWVAFYVSTFYTCGYLMHKCGFVTIWLFHIVWLTKFILLNCLFTPLTFLLHFTVFITPVVDAGFSLKQRNILLLLQWEGLNKFISFGTWRVIPHVENATCIWSHTPKWFQNPRIAPKSNWICVFSIAHFPWLTDHVWAKSKVSAS